jgi:hypothetical protein
MLGKGRISCNSGCPGVNNVNPRGGWGKPEASVWFVASHATIEYGIGAFTKPSTTLGRVAQMWPGDKYVTSLVKCGLIGQSYAATYRACSSWREDYSGKTVIFDGVHFWAMEPSPRMREYCTENIAVLGGGRFIWVKPHADPAVALSEILNVVR